MASNINVVTLTGNITKDPEVRDLPSGTKVCTLRLAVNGSIKNQDGGWDDKPNYFNVAVFGGQAAACEQYLTKGRPVAVSGRLDWSEWEKDGVKREDIKIIASVVQFLGAGETGNSTPTHDVKVDMSGLAPAKTVTTDDIPF